MAQKVFKFYWHILLGIISVFSLSCDDEVGGRDPAGATETIIGFWTIDDIMSIKIRMELKK